MSTKSSRETLSSRFLYALLASMAIGACVQGYAWAVERGVFDRIGNIFGTTHLFVSVGAMTYLLMAVKT